MTATSLKFLEGGGAMGERIRAFDWQNHPMGLPQQWPEALRLSLSLCLHSSFPTAIYWGPDLYVLYNDAWSEIPAEKHPWILGKPAHEGWSDIWSIVGPQFHEVVTTGQGLALYERMLPMVRGGQPRETWWNYSFTPIRNPDHSVGGIFNQGNEVTELVFARRQREAELARWRDMFRQAPTPVALLRGSEHRFEFANESYRQLVGGGRDLEGKPLRAAIPEVVDQGFLALLDRVYRTGEPYVGAGVKVNLQRAAEGPTEERIQDFIYQPIRDGAGNIDGILVLVTDVTDRARAEAALRISNWQLGEERARLASLMEAEQRARLALRRFSDSLEATVKSRTAELTRALEAQQSAADRLRAAFATELILQAFMDADGTVRDANPASLAAIQRPLHEVVGQPFWDTPWFTATEGEPQRIRADLDAARRGRTVRRDLKLHLPEGERSFRFLVRPVHGARGELFGLVAESMAL